MYLGLEDPLLKQHHEDGHVCGDNNGKIYYYLDRILHQIIITIYTCITIVHESLLYVFEWIKVVYPIFWVKIFLH